MSPGESSTQAEEVKGLRGESEVLRVDPVRPLRMTESYHHCAVLEHSYVSEDYMERVGSGLKPRQLSGWPGQMGWDTVSLEVQVCLLLRTSVVLPTQDDRDPPGPYPSGAES